MSGDLFSNSKLIAYKIIDYNEESPRSMAGHIPIPTNMTSYIGEPMFFSLDRQYVLDNYCCNDINLLITVEFDRRDVVSGNLTDKETEFTLSEFTIIKKEKFAM